MSFSLTVDMEYFLPALPYLNIEWLRGMWSGKKKVRPGFFFLNTHINTQALLNKNVIQFSCPHIRGMRVEDLVKLMEDQNLEFYLSCPTINGYPPKYDRDWLLLVR